MPNPEVFGAQHPDTNNAPRSFITEDPVEMATSVKLQHDVRQLCLIGATGMTFILGLMIHFFMLGVSVIDWMKGRPLTTVDHLITSIVTSRITFQLVSLFHVFLISFHGSLSAAYNIAISITGSSSVDCNMWFSVLLSVFYSLKISNIHNNFFSNLKKMISQRVLGLITMFVLLSIGSISVEFLMVYMTVPRNSTQEANLRITHIIYFFSSLLYLRNVLPLLFYFISSFAILGSLCHHVYRMTRLKNVTSLDTYYRTIKFTIVSFFCLALYVIFNMFRMYIFGFAGSFLVGNGFLVLHSIHLIYMTARLRSHFFDILHFMTKRLLLRKRSGSGSGFQMQLISQ
ncbi:taste receptor type 2 member 19-like [Phyllobates terribilis]|uniref:taste receptor type 2 member 19-like n=1 Tax=Phyllobates terribilis TaxID=111132 RepID=UPI003CCA7B58